MTYQSLLFDTDNNRMIFFIPNKPTFNTIEGIGMIVNGEILIPTNDKLREISTKKGFNTSFLLIDKDLRLALCRDYHYCLDCSHQNKKS